MVTVFLLTLLYSAGHARSLRELLRPRPNSHLSSSHPTSGAGAGAGEGDAEAEEEAGLAEHDRPLPLTGPID